MNRVIIFLLFLKFLVIFDGLSFGLNPKCRDESFSSTDTLKHVFLFETHVDSYIEGEDAVIKEGGFIKYDSSKVGLTYEEGYFMVNLSGLNNRFNSIFSIDSISVLNLYERLLEINWVEEGLDDDISPFCGTFYRKFYLEIIVCKVGFEDEIVPLPLSCDDLDYYFEKNKRRNKSLNIPIYAIVNVLKWEEL